MKLRKAKRAFSVPYSSDLLQTEHRRFDADGQNNGWRSEAAIIEALPLRVNDLSEGSDGAGGRRDGGSCPWRWITDV